MKCRFLDPLALALAAAFPLTFSSTLLADVTLSPLFSDGAVFQQKQPIPVWGKADPGEAVTVSLEGSEEKTTADASGKWRVNLPAIPAGGPFELTVKGNNLVVVHDVAVGEVWIASGQSNMAFMLQATRDTEAVAAAADPMLRFFTVARTAVIEPVDSLALRGGPWQASTPETARKFSAVGYYFARELREKLKVPVGVVHSSWGGTPAQAWTSLSALEANPAFSVYLRQRLKDLENFPQAEKNYREVALVEWKAAEEAAKANGSKPPRKPLAPVGPNHSHLPGNLYSGMVHPLLPYGIRGVIWYQGESNGRNPGDGLIYRTLFPAMIQDWRSRWHQGDFPFLFVQLANYQAPQTEPVEQKEWPLAREAQLMALSLPHTGMASAVDLADADNPGDIHPHNKKDVGHRLALNAFAKVYDLPVPSYSGPIFTGMAVEGNKARLSFDHVDGGLQAKGEKLAGFAIAGKEGPFVWGDAVIDGDTVVVSSETVQEPARVRYGWAMNPIGNLYNKEGLPASPFRTDTDAGK
ncbi:MAG TPA: sialate O-acetylesterase [Chthoniobacteraceae bacterium]|nr:sialate O-acetylesterase [Chthoniobacteraceae bacterium]